MEKLMPSPTQIIDGFTGMVDGIPVRKGESLVISTKICLQVQFTSRKERFQSLLNQ